MYICRQQCVGSNSNISTVAGCGLADVQALLSPERRAAELQLLALRHCWPQQHPIQIQATTLGYAGNWIGKDDFSAATAQSCTIQGDIP